MSDFPFLPHLSFLFFFVILPSFLSPLCLFCQWGVRRAVFVQSQSQSRSQPEPVVPLPIPIPMRADETVLMTAEDGGGDNGGDEAGEDGDDEEESEYDSESESESEEEGGAVGGGVKNRDYRFGASWVEC